ncbi:hypothetical protein HAX54_053184 [Datura stramonium]|uniref:Macro domain-containing protein n=1 Tax=Datura stramonium TaxID=4076 RepID=A0ABS8SZZ1_DATST|nr:hypothetical protein [Datura stramonium]
MHAIKYERYILEFAAQQEKQGLPQVSDCQLPINSLRVAKENNIQYIAFPAISCGVYGYPYDEATVAISTVKEFGSDLKEVHFVLFSDEIYDAWVTAA